MIPGFADDDERGVPCLSLGSDYDLLPKDLPSNGQTLGRSESLSGN